MWTPIPVAEFELTRPLAEPVEAVAGARFVKALLRFRGNPVGWMQIPIAGGRLVTDNIVEQVLDEHFELISRWALSECLSSGLPLSEGIIDDLSRSVIDRHPSAPSISVLVCTRERPDDLRRCLTALCAAQPAPFEVLVIDNAPITEHTKQVVQEFPGVRYAHEPRPGLDWARNRGVLDARGDIVAFIDDDVVVDSRWAGALQHTFASHPSVAAVTGLVAPYELATAAQAHFELHGGFGRGFVPRWFQHPAGSGVPWRALGTGVLGTGANMAFRRSLFDNIGLFLPELDTGTVTEGGGDLEILYRTLKHGYPIAYEPRALAWHRHRREPEHLIRQIGSWGIATFAMLESVKLRYPDEATNIRSYGRFWKRRLFKRAAGQYLRPERMPAEVRNRELKGSFIGKRRYYAALEIAKRIAVEFGPQPGAPNTRGAHPVLNASPVTDRRRIAVRTVDLAHGAQAIEDVSDYWTTRVFVHHSGRPLGHFEITNKGTSISRERFIDEMLESKSAVVWLHLALDASPESISSWLRASLKSVIFPTASQADSGKPASARRCTGRGVSIVLATCDRPEELRRCLRSLTALPQHLDLEILVVDNRPESPATANVVKDFPTAVLVAEPRQGLSYARNAGFVRATGDIIVCTDDDVVFAHDWLDNLLAPFRRDDIDIVCGNVLPMALDEESQIRFEQYGGLGRGYEPFEVDQDWFFRNWAHAVETWTLGATANTAFRAAMLRDPNVGLFEEVLGPGVPSGVGEDTYFFYRALLNGYRIRYEPSAVVWHEHRRTSADLKRQLSAYSTGHVAYHLHTLLKHRDLRALPHLARVAAWHARRASLLLLRSGNDPFPLDLVATEVIGNLRGPLALWRSHRVVNARGRSAPMPSSPSPTQAAPADAAPPAQLADLVERQAK